jgi:hypothetical protein
MARIKHFSDTSAGPVELDFVSSMPNAEFAAAFPGVKGRRDDGYSMRIGYVKGNRTPFPVTRAIEFKSFPSRHECDARCINATGRIMKCECSCGGKNHGKGAFNCSPSN